MFVSQSKLGLPSSNKLIVPITLGPMNSGEGKRVNKTIVPHGMAPDLRLFGLCRNSRD